MPPADNPFAWQPFVKKRLTVFHCIFRPKIGYYGSFWHELSRWKSVGGPNLGHILDWVGKPDDAHPSFFMYNSLLYKPEKEREIFIICKRRSVWQDKTWWACLWVVGGGRWGRHLLTTPASNQLQPHTTTTTLLPPSCFPEVKLNSNMQQLVAFCIFGGFGLCCAVAELSRLFLKKNLTSYLSSPSMISIPSTNIPILKLFESLSLQAALYGLLEQGGGEGHRP